LADTGQNNESEQGVAGAQNEQKSLAWGRDGGEFEGGERLAQGRTGLVHVPSNARVVRSASSCAQRAARWRAAPQPSRSARSAKLCQSPPVVGRRRVVGISGSWAAYTQPIRFLYLCDFGDDWGAGLSANPPLAA
jgi:hypothetical protein